MNNKSNVSIYFAAMAALSLGFAACSPGLRMKENTTLNPKTIVVQGTNPTTEALIPFSVSFKSLSGDLVGTTQSTIQNGKVEFVLKDFKSEVEKTYSIGVAGTETLSTINGNGASPQLTNEPTLIVSSRCSDVKCTAFEVAVKIFFNEGSRLIDSKVLALSMDTKTKVTKSLYMSYGPDVNIITMNEIMLNLSVLTDPLATP